MMDVLQHTIEVVTNAKVTETVEMTETAANKAQHERIPKRRKERFVRDFFLS